MARGRKAHLFSERNRSLACPFLPSIFPSGGSLGASWWHIGALLGYLRTAVGFLGARMSCFPHLDSPSVLGASGQELQSEPALVSLKQTSGRGPKTREAQRPSSTNGTSLVFSPFGPPAARMPWFPRLDRPSVLVLAASSAVLRPLWALLDRYGAVLRPP